MSKISNTTAYPTVTPASNDLVVITDVSDSNSTKTATVGSISSSSSSLFITASKTLTPTEILSLNTAGTAVELLPAPGAGKILVVDSFIFKLQFNTTAYNFTNGTGGQDNSLVIGLLVRDNAQPQGFKWKNGTPLNAFNYTQTYTAGGLNAGAFAGIVSTSGPLRENTAFSIATRYDNTTVTQGDSNVLFTFVYRIIDSTTLL
tara:strand:+ start:4806 stop:5414 length:609 start_codon:yes stop_codon:yes gene_type:complete